MTSNPSAPSGRDPASSDEHDNILFFRKCPVRIVMVGGVPWFALPDLCEAAGYHPRAAQAVEARDFPDHAKMILFEEMEDGTTREVVLVTSVGAYWLTTLTNPGKGQQLAAWTRREALDLCPTAARTDPAFYLTLSPTLELPPRPMRYTGRFPEWDDLRFSREYQDRPIPNVRLEMQTRLLAEAERNRLAATGKSPQFNSEKTNNGNR